MNVIQVREYAKLVRSERSMNGTLDEAYISEAAFEFLAELIQQGKLAGTIFLDYIKLGSQVGYLETVDLGIEILPKTALHTADHQHDQLRELLQKMISVVFQVRSKEMQSAHLVRNRLPLHEWIYLQFLNELKVLLRKGLKGDYERVSRTEKFMRGRLDIREVMRRKVGQDHLFPVEYDEFNFNRLENRLIKTALTDLFKYTKNRENWRIANEMMQRLSGLETIHSAYLQLNQWQDQKLMQNYRAIFPWCRLILEKMNPHFQQGQHKGIALLFPMEKLFEAYVGDYLKRNCVNYDVKTQEEKHHLVMHQGQGYFQLKPDFILRHRLSNQLIIADSKWKMIDESKDNERDKYGIAQADMYQMLAYGYQYQKDNQVNCQKIILVYPYHEKFTATLPVFDFHSENLKLWAVPFKLWTCDAVKEGLIVSDEFFDL